MWQWVVYDSLLIFHIDPTASNIIWHDKMSRTPWHVQHVEVQERVLQESQTTSLQIPLSQLYILLCLQHCFLPLDEGVTQDNAQFLLIIKELSTTQIYAT